MESHLGIIHNAKLIPQTTISTIENNHFPHFFSNETTFQYLNSYFFIESIRL